MHPMEWALWYTKGTGPIVILSQQIWGPIYKISYDLIYRKVIEFIVRSTYDSDLQRAKISLRNIVS